MKSLFFVSACLCLSIHAAAQFPELPFGRTTLAEVEMKTYKPDTSAAAVVLYEKGQSFAEFDPEEGGRLVYDYYVRIKILKKSGQSYGDFEIPLYKTDTGDREKVISLTASSFNLSPGLQESKLDDSKPIVENYNKNYEIRKFAMPNVHVGTVIEVRYRVVSMMVFNFRHWEFQSGIPKIRSEYNTMVAGNFTYNITLRGSLSLTTNESKLVNDCIKFGVQTASCVKSLYAIDNIPAFKEEKYMTSKKNFLSAIYFELSQFTNWSGTTKKFTKEWRDVDLEYRDHEEFGKQVRKAKSAFEDKVPAVLGVEADPLKKAKLVYDLVISSIVWNDTYGAITDVGVKRALETKTGNDADINLSLVGALQAAGLDASPVILSTREHGVPIEVHPVINDFNYVVAGVQIGPNFYLADATNNIRPFGMLPMRCLNGKGRYMTKESTWVDIVPSEKQKTARTFDLTLTPSGDLEGKLTITYSGYDALERRATLLSENDADKARKEFETKLGDAEVTNYQVDNLRIVDKPLIEKMDIKIKAGQKEASTIFVTPFLLGGVSENPFRSDERTYPVDFGAPLEETMVLSISLPASYVVDEIPANVGLALPKGGGRFLFNASKLGDKLSIVSSQILSRPVYNAEDYHYIRELYARIVQVNQSQIVLKRK